LANKLHSWLADFRALISNDLFEIKAKVKEIYYPLVRGNVQKQVLTSLSPRQIMLRVRGYRGIGLRQGGSVKYVPLKMMLSMLRSLPQKWLIICAVS
jgi:hypothetical protein